MMLPTDAAMTTRRSSLGATRCAAISPPPMPGRLTLNLVMRDYYALALPTHFESRPPLDSLAGRPEASSPHGVRYRAAVSPAGRGRLRRATPHLTAASATAEATASGTRRSNIDGMMYSSLSSLFETISASAC